MNVGLANLNLGGYRVRVAISGNRSACRLAAAPARRMHSSRIRESPSRPRFFLLFFSHHAAGLFFVIEDFFFFFFLHVTTLLNKVAAAAAVAQEESCPAFSRNCDGASYLFRLRKICNRTRRSVRDARGEKGPDSEARLRGQKNLFRQGLPLENHHHHLESSSRSIISMLIPSAILLRPSSRIP